MRRTSTTVGSTQHAHRPDGARGRRRGGTGSNGDHRHARQLQWRRHPLEHRALLRGELPGHYGESSNEDDEANVDTWWLGDSENAQPPEHYGWVVEIDPFDKESKPRKQTWLGSIRHENVALRVSESGRVVAYTGHDQEDECTYRVHLQVHLLRDL